MEKKLKELAAKGKALLAEIEQMQGAEKPDADAIKGKVAEFDAIDGKIAEVKANIARAKTLAAAEADGAVDTKGKELGRVEFTDQKGEEIRAKEQGFWDFVRSAADDSIKLSDRMRDALRPQSKSFKDSGMLAAVIPDRMVTRMFGRKVSEVLGKTLPMGGGIPTLGAPFSTATGGVGGTVQTVPPDFRAMLLELAPEPTYILQRANVVPAPYGSVSWPILRQADGSEYGGVTGEWIEEGGTKPDTEAKIDQLAVKTYEYAAYTELTNRLLSRSAIQLEPLLTRLFRDKVMDALDTAFLRGNGVGQPLGICDITSGARIVSRDVAGTVGYVDYINLEHAVLPFHRKNAIFVMQDSAVRVSRLQKTTNGLPLWIPAFAGYGVGQPATINGREYVDTIRLPALGSRGDVVFGDWSQYIVAMEEEVVLQRSEHFKFKNNLTAFRVSVVVGGKPAQPRAFSILDAVASSTTNAAQSSTTVGA